MTTSTQPQRTVFLDTEFTTLDRQRREVWEIGAIVRDPGQPDREYEWQLRPDLREANEVSLRIGGYYQRCLVKDLPVGSAIEVVHPKRGDRPEDDIDYAVDGTTAAKVAAELAGILDGARIVGNVIWADEMALWRMFRQLGHALTVDYHLVDVRSMLLGYVHAAAQWAPKSWHNDKARREALVRVTTDTGWSSVDLGAIVGIPAPADQHRALADARWAREFFDHMTRYQQPAAA